MAKKTKKRAAWGSKQAIVAKMLVRKRGTTSEEVRKATGWPVVSMPSLAKAAGIALRSEPIKGRRALRYYGTTVA
jgi:hypothetical protein